MTFPNRDDYGLYTETSDHPKHPSQWMMQYIHYIHYDVDMEKLAEDLHHSSSLLISGRDIRNSYQSMIHDSLWKYLTCDMQNLLFPINAIETSYEANNKAEDEFVHIVDILDGIEHQWRCLLEDETIEIKDQYKNVINYLQRLFGQIYKSMSYEKSKLDIRLREILCIFSNETLISEAVTMHSIYYHNAKKNILETCIKRLTQYDIRDILLHRFQQNLLRQEANQNKKNELKKKKKRIGLNPKAINQLQQWYDEHFYHPYPSNEEKKQLADVTELSVDQVNTWFTNKRGRQWKPKIHEILESQENQDELQKMLNQFQMHI